MFLDIQMKHISKLQSHDFIQYRKSFDNDPMGNGFQAKRKQGWNKRFNKEKKHI